MNANLSFYLAPLFWQLLLTLIILFRLAALRINAIQNRQVKLKDIAINANAWPEKIRQVSNSLSNQFETPVLFYLLLIIVMQLSLDSTLMRGLCLAWLVFRTLHAFEHCGRNDVRIRFYYFLASVLILTTAWILVAVRVLKLWLM